MLKKQAPVFKMVEEQLMKRIVCCLLSIAIISIVFFANAENKHTPFVQHIWEDEVLYDWVQILGLDEKLESEPIKENNEIIQSLHSDNPPDFFSVYGYELSDYLSEDFCAPFTPSDKMLDDIHAMPPIIQQALKQSIFTKDNKLYAYPVSIEAAPMLYWVPEAWADSPFHSIDPPTSYTELLDFLEAYLDTPHDGYCFYYDVDGSTNPRRDWILLLLECWVTQCNYNHQAINLNNTEFISLLKKTVELTSKLYKAEPNKKKQKGRQLITKGLYGYTTNGKDNYTWKNMIPWRLTSDQLPLVNVWMHLYCARQGSSFSSRTTDLFNCIIDHRQDLYFGDVNYLRYLYLNRKWIDVNEYNKQVRKEFGSSWACMNMTQEYVDSIWEIEKWGIPCIVNNDYFFNIPWEIETKCDHLLIACAGGDISAEEFAEKMDQLVVNSY